MLISEEKTKELLLLLDRLGSLETRELLAHFTSENIESLRVISALLKDESRFERVLSENRFVDVVRELYETKKIWEAKLKESLSSSAGEFEKGNHIQALWIINGFIRFCPSPYFRNLAEETMGKYEGGE